MIQASSLVSIGTTAGHDPLEELAALGGHGETRFFFGASCLMGIMPLGPFFLLLFVALRDWGLHPGVARGHGRWGAGPSVGAGCGWQECPRLLYYAL